MQTEAIVVIVNILSKDDKIDFARKELLSLINVTRNEKGCVVFDLHEDKDNPAHFFFYEEWETKELWEIHMNTPFFNEYKEKTADAFAEISFNLMEKIDN